VGFSEGAFVGKLVVGIDVGKLEVGTDVGYARRKITFLYIEARLTAPIVCLVAGLSNLVAFVETAAESMLVENDPDSTESMITAWMSVLNSTELSYTESSKDLTTAK